MSDLDKAIETIKKLINGGMPGYTELVKTAEKYNATLSQFDKLVRILEETSDKIASL